MFLTMGTTDLGRLFYYSIAMTNAAREAARQGTYYDPMTNTNSLDSYTAVLAAAQQDIPGEITVVAASVAPTHCLTGSPTSWSGNYPTNPNTAFVYICFDGNDAQVGAAQNTIEVRILYNFQPITPFADLVGASSVHVLASTTMQVQHQS